MQCKNEMRFLAVVVMLSASQAESEYFTLGHEVFGDGPAPTKWVRIRHTSCA